MQEIGRLDAICISQRKGEKKKPLPAARLLENHGIEDDAHAGDWHRQVSLLDAADVEYMRKRGLPELKAGDFAENLTVSGISLVDIGLGSKLRIGKDVCLEITQIGKTCHSHCAIYHQTGDCIMPRHGLFARVCRGGTVKTGDDVIVETAIHRTAFQAVVLTISDRCSRGEATDTAGPAVAELLSQQLQAHIYAAEIIPDDQSTIAARLKHYCDGHSIDLAVAVGGTGFTPRDVTPEAVRSVVERLTPGLDEAMRQGSLQVTPHAMLSRAVSGICQSTLVLSLPGAEKAARENLQLILPALPHGLKKLRGDPSECGEPTS